MEEQHNDGVLLEQDTMPHADQEPREPVEPVKEVEDEPAKAKEIVVNKESEVEEVKPQMNQVKFADSLILTSYKLPQPKKEKKEQPKKPVSILKPTASKAASPVEQEVPKASAAPQKVTPVVERKVPEKLSPQVKPLLVKPAQKVVEEKEGKEEEKPPGGEAKMVEERTEEAPKLEPEM